MSRPNVFSYQDYRRFLSDWLAFKKAGQKRFSLRSLAKQSGLATGYLPMVLSGKRVLSLTAWNRLAPHLGLNSRERAFFENLLALGTSPMANTREAAIDKMKRSLQFQQLNPRETEIYDYLTHWHYIAIREMATLPDFKEDLVWIQERLKYPVAVADIAAALSFLLKHEFLTRDKDGHIVAPEKALDCSGGIYKAGLAKYHREWLRMAGESIETSTSAERLLLGHTVALAPQALIQARAIVEEAIQKIRDIGSKESAGESVYHIEMALFPLTHGKKE